MHKANDDGMDLRIGYLSTRNHQLVVGLTARRIRPAIRRAMQRGVTASRWWRGESSGSVLWLLQFPPPVCRQIVSLGFETVAMRQRVIDVIAARPRGFWIEAYGRDDREWFAVWQHLTEADLAVMGSEIMGQMSSHFDQGQHDTDLCRMLREPSEAQC